MAIVIPFKNKKQKFSIFTSEGALKSLQNIVSDDLAIVDRIILQRIENASPLVKKIAKHLISSGGKRLRPLLTLACAKLCNYSGEQHLNLAACIELMHAATLLHDDVIDASNLRRGIPSANAVFGNHASVLVGDFLFSSAFQLLVEINSDEALPLLSQTALTIAEGEIRQLAVRKDISISEQIYLEIITAKTAKLFSAACQLAALISREPRNKQEALRTFGLNFGIAYQIIDDVLDYTANESYTEKNKGNDFREGNITLPVILAIHRGDDAEREFWRKVFNKRKRNGEDFLFAIDILKRRKSLEDAVKRANHYVSIARDALGVFQDNPVKNALLMLANSIIED